MIDYDIELEIVHVVGLRDYMKAHKTALIIRELEAAGSIRGAARNLKLAHPNLMRWMKRNGVTQKKKAKTGAVSDSALNPGECALKTGRGIDQSRPMERQGGLNG